MRGCELVFDSHKEVRAKKKNSLLKYMHALRKFIDPYDPSAEEEDDEDDEERVESAGETRLKMKRTEGQEQEKIVRGFSKDESKAV